MDGMDMDGMDMDGMDMDGMDMGHSGHDDDMSSMTMSGGIFTPTDQRIARGFWYAVAGCVALLTVVRAVSILQAQQRLKQHRLHPDSIPSRPTGWLSQAYATATATTRELLYPQPIYFTGRFSRYFSPLPLGRWLLLALYWVLILCFLWSNTILKPTDALYPYKWEIVGFRAAWVTVTQIPFIYLLSCKFNPITILTGISFERFNWLHRWVARTVFLTAIVHWSFFYTEWSIYKIITFQLEMMPMVKYGFGAWGIITWMVLSGFGFFRALSYELFVAQHIVAAAVLLWALFVHVPSYAAYNIWLSVGFVAFDWGMRIIWAVTRNLHVLGKSSDKIAGYSVRLEPLPGDVVRLTIDIADFEWKAGQLAYLSIPCLRPFEMHPFTIANTRESRDSKGRLQMLIQARSGFSRTLYNAAVKGSHNDRRYRAFLSGPWGNPPDLLHYDTVVLIACSSGASFIMPLLQQIVRRQGCVRSVTLHWVIRSDEHFSWFSRELEWIADAAQQSEMHIRMLVHITSSQNAPYDEAQITASQAPVSVGPGGPSKNTDIAVTTTLRTDAGEASSLSSLDSIEKAPPRFQYKESLNGRMVSLSRKYNSRPTLDSMIRPPVEQALGETAIVVCGGLSITAESRTFVAALSDERAVHKGTGAQGIFLFTETYGW